jgi:excisionase family DNA binding protein
MKTYTPEPIAEMLHVVPETVRHRARAGRLSGVRLGRAGWRFTEADLQSFLGAHRTRWPEHTPTPT